MRKRILSALSLMLAVSILAAAGCASGDGNQGDDSTEASQEESEGIAREYLVNSPTFRFDGIEETLELVSVNAMRCPYCWQFVFEFDCRHAGYGDRTGLVLAQVITPHTGRIVVIEGDVVSAVLDDDWDMMEQGMIPGSSG